MTIVEAMIIMTDDGLQILEYTDVINAIHLADSISKSPSVTSTVKAPLHLHTELCDAFHCDCSLLLNQHTKLLLLCLM